MRVLALITGVALTIGASTIGAGAASAAGEQPTARDDASRRICRMVTPTGSRLAIRSCRTKAEWDEEAAQSRRGAEEQSRNDNAVRPGAFTKAY